MIFQHGVILSGEARGAGYFSVASAKFTNASHMVAVPSDPRIASVRRRFKKKN